MMKVKVAGWLKTGNLRTPKFYSLPKICKKGNPGRPVVSSLNCHTSVMSKCVDSFTSCLERNR